MPIFVSRLILNARTAHLETTAQCVQKRCDSSVMQPHSRFYQLMKVMLIRKMLSLAALGLIVSCAGNQEAEQSVNSKLADCAKTVDRECGICRPERIPPVVLKGAVGRSEVSAGIAVLKRLTYDSPS